MFIVLFSLLAIVTAQTSGGRKCSTLGDNVGLNATATVLLKFFFSIYLTKKFL